MAYSLKITQQAAVDRVVWFIKQKDRYNAQEALKDVAPWIAEHLRLTAEIKTIPYN